MKSPEQIVSYVSILLLIIINFSCNTTEPPPGNGDKPELLLKLEDASCTEAWITLTTTNLTLPAEIELIKDTTVTETISLSSSDTLLYIDSLLPNQTYQFQASDIQFTATSNKLTISTMDTTSHDFTFETFTFGGQAGSCVLYDVAIIDENNIWAVGEIYLLDSLGNPDPNAYNAVHWDGSEWTLHRIMFQTICGQPHRGSYPAKSIFAFDENNIWITSGSQITHFNGNEQLSLRCIPVSVNKIWGTDNNNLYAVGVSGKIAHFNGTGWQKIESGTELSFLDIYGALNPQTGKEEILAVCTRNLPLDKGIFRIEGNTATEISSEPIQWELFALWFIPNRHYYIVGSGIYEKNSLSDNLWQNEPLDITHYGTGGIRGTGLNDVFVAGAFGVVLHFNGITWKSYLNELGWFSGSYGGIAVKDNLVVTVGYESAKARILIGKR